MNDRYPELLTDRQVTVVRGTEPEQARLRSWLDGYDGPVPTYRIELVTRCGNYTCPYTATAPDIFETLIRLRRQLEPDGLRIAVQGSRQDTYPSGMMRDMGGGQQVYVMRPGKPAGFEDLVDTLADAPQDQLATVEAQERFAHQWRTSLSTRPKTDQQPPRTSERSEQSPAAQDSDGERPARTGETPRE